MRRQLLYLALIGALASLYDHSVYLTSRWRVTEDARHHLFWTYRFQDPGLFPDDLYARFFSSLAPLGYRAFYFLVAQVTDPVFGSKLVPFGFLAVSVWYLWRIGRLFEPRWGGLLAGLMFLEYSGALRGGLPRSFAFPLLIAHLFYVAARRWGGASLLLVLQALFYPQAFLNGLGLQGVAVIRDCGGFPGPCLAARLRAGARPAGWLLAGALASFALLAPTYLFDDTRRALGPLVTRAEAARLPEFQGDRGAVVSVEQFRYLWRGDRSGLGWNTRLTSFAAGLAVFAAVLGRKFLRAPRVLFDSLAVSLVLFAAAHLLLFRLHLPNRYVRYTLPLAAMLMLACLARPVVEELGERVPAFRRLWPALVRWRTTFAVLLALAVLGGAVKTVFFTPNRVDPREVELHQFLATLPRTALVAGNTRAVGWVPLLARRRALVDDEFALPYLRGYYREVVRRREAQAQALQTGSPEALGRFCREFGVTHLVIDPGGPVSAEIVRWVEGQRVFQNARFLVAPCPGDVG